MTTSRAAVPASRPASPYRNLRTVRGPLSAFLWLRGVLAQRLSVRAKLTLWYGFMCAMTLAITGAAMKEYIDSRFTTDIRSSLTNTARLVDQMTASSIVSSPSKGAQYTSSGSCSDLTAPDQRELRKYCVRIQNALYNATGELTASGQFEEVLLTTNNRGSSAAPIRQPGLPGRALPGINPLDLVQVASTGQAKFRDIVYNGRSMTQYIAPLHLPPFLQAKGYVGLVEVVQDQRTYNQIKQRFDQTLLLGIPLGVIIALVAGWWIARTALRPIDRISRTVRTIGESKDLTRRLRFVGPDDEVGRLAGTFDGMMDRLEHVFETQKRFIADASHELRTPLTAIRGNADLMSIAPPEERAVCLASIRSEAERMSRLVSDLLLLAEADVAQEQLHTRPLELDSAVAEVYRSATVLAAGKVDVILEASEPVRVNGDPDRLKQLLLNLLDNAIKFTPRGGVVSIGVCRSGNEARLDVSDSGVGIPPEEQEAIFERFYRVETSRSKRGSGLGLAISAWVVRAHGGRIDVRSEPGKGSTFSVWLPLMTEEPAEPQEAPSGETGGRGRRRKPPAA